MRQDLVDFSSMGIQYVLGNADVMAQMQLVPARSPFDDSVVELLATVSKALLSDKNVRKYSDVVTLAFWMRKASVEMLRKRFCEKNHSVVELGRGIVFHIAPSNVPVNYAYSLAAGLLCGNKNVVRIPSKDFEQVEIINQAFEEALAEMPVMKPYLCLVRYGHDQEINDALSAIADVRVVWGGDATIRELRKSALKARASEITFADRYSLAVIDSDVYMQTEDRDKLANDFYNDTYLTDQNACTSPRAVVWVGKRIEEAKAEFWDRLHKLLVGRYEITGVQAVGKLASSYRLAASREGVKKISAKDNLIVRLRVDSLTADLMEFRDHSGYFFEYECEDIMAIREFCDDDRCQTVSYVGDVDMFRPLVASGVSGIDRIVPMGKTMDFDLIWDGYNLYERMTRRVVLQ